MTIKAAFPLMTGTAYVKDRLGWVHGTMCYENFFLFLTHGTDNTNKTLLNPGGIGSIGPYVGSADVYRCPADSSWVLINGQRHARVRSYSMNRYLGNAAVNIGDPDGKYFLQEDEFLNKPDSILLFIDEHEDTIQDGIFEMGLRSPFTYSLPASRHGSGAALTYVAGNIHFKRWQTIGEEFPVIHELRFRIPVGNNPDFAWIRKRLTYPIE